MHIQAGDGCEAESHRGRCYDQYFFIFINDLDNSISSDVLKFADDTKIYSIGCQYNMNGQALAEVTAEKDLGVV